MTFFDCKKGPAPVHGDGAHIDGLQDGALEALVLLLRPAGVPEEVRQVLERRCRLERVCIGLRHAPAGDPEAAGAHHSRVRRAPHRICRL